MVERFADANPDLLPSLRKRYNADGRAYHNWAHVQALLGHFEHVVEDLNDAMSVEIALYYHDVVYVPGSPTNEHDSADIMMAEMTGRAEPHQLASADLIIRATAGHAVPDGTELAVARDCVMFLDMDLAILGAEPEAFDAFDTAIRQEFSMVPDQIFYPRRRDVLKSFLEREHIYLTDQFHDCYDGPARANLARVVDKLTRDY